MKVITIDSKCFRKEFEFHFSPDINGNNDGYGVLWIRDNGTGESKRLESGFYRTDDHVLALQTALTNHGEYQSYDDLKTWWTNQDALYNRA